MTVLRREMEWHFDLTPEQLWPVVSHTAKVNEAAGFPTYRLEETAQADGSVDRRGSVSIAGIKVAWEECPFEWVANRSFVQKRVFTSGPIRTGTIRFSLTPDGDGSRVHVELVVDAANIAGAVAGRVLMQRFSKTFGRLTHQAADYLKGNRAKLYDYQPPAPGAQARRRAEAAVERLEQGPYAHGLARRLKDYLFEEQNASLDKIRPLALAREWQVPPRHASELCLAAVDAGLLGMRWELLCPSCRGGKDAVTTLDRLPSGAHCPSCNIDYGRDFAKNVELAFFPSAQIRSVPVGGYCLSGPTTTPHVLVQQTLEAGAERRVEVALGPGRYRARRLTGGEHVEFEVGEDGALPRIAATADGMEAAEGGETGMLTLVNATSRTLTLVVESREWVADALTAHQVTTLQAFRDLFAQAALRPGDEASVDRVTLLFSDLKGSTALYERVGDAAAYNLVREHFAYLAAIVRENGGALVKTIGDAVMAAFAEPGDAVRAAIAIQERIGEFNAAHPVDAEGEAIIVKLGVHQGPCVVVTLNGQLDYFGSTVNLAARLQGQSEGGDLVVSEAIADDPAVVPLVENLPLARESATLRGFARPVPFRRVAFTDKRAAA